MKRIFVAIKISEVLQDEAERWASDFSDLSVRWVPKENLHITLVPPWGEDDISGVMDCVEKIRGEVSSFEVCFNKITYGPNPFNPRLIWAEGSFSEELVFLQERICELLGAEVPKRKFKPHLTLVRFRPEDYFSFSIKNLNEKIDWVEAVDLVCVIESILKPMGVEYVVLKEIKF